MANQNWFDFEKDIADLCTQLEKARATHEEGKLDMTDMMLAIETKIKEAQAHTYSHLTGWQKVQISRHPDRPYTLDYIENICTDFVELFGDRQVKDDKAMLEKIESVYWVRMQEADERQRQVLIERGIIQED